MQVARNSRALRLDCPRTQMPQQKDVLERRAHILRHLLKPRQIVRQKWSRTWFPVSQKQPPHRMIFLVERHRNEVADTKFVQRRAWYAGQNLPTLRVPAA